METHCYSSFDINDFMIKSNEILTDKLKFRIPISFVIIEESKYLFLIKNEEAQHFKFGMHIESQMELHYFDIEYVKSTNALLSLSKDDSTIKYILLVTRRNAPNRFCYTAISNNWLTLDEHSLLKVLDNFDGNSYS